MSDPRARIRRLAGHTCVTAGAGAGKTTCLVDTYLGLLAGTWQGPALAPEQVVAITFTEKAAAEMRTRVVKQVAELAAGQVEGGGIDWRGLLSRVEWAPISTIHSFCATLLREFGAGIGLDPDFAILDGDDFAQLLDQQSAALLRRLLQKDDPRLARLLAHYSLGELEIMLGRLYGRLTTAGISAAQARRATREAHQEAAARGPGLVANLAARIEELTAELAAGLPITAKTKYAKKIKELQESWPRLHEQLQEDFRHQESLELLWSLIKGGSWQKANHHRQALEKIVAELLDLVALPQAQALSDDFLSLAEELEAALERELARRSGLSFDHLLLETRRLLEQDHQVLAELRRRWRVLMVDEFQDVNPVQAQLVRLLAGLQDPPDYCPPEDEQPPRLLLVGDRKQSIYAFRGAEVAQFSRVLEEFGRGVGRVEALPENFRSAPVLVEFFNRLFPQVFSQQDKREHAPASYLEFSRDDEQRPARDKPYPPGDNLQVLKIRGEEDWNADRWRQAEARVLGEHLARLLGQGDYRPGEVVILLRKLSQVQVYEEGLARAGLPFYTVRGRGFFDCQEVADLLALLRVLLDPGDQLSLAAVLRSPLVGLSDEALLALSFDQQGRRRGLARALEGGVALPGWLGEKQAARWQAAQGLIGGLRPLARRLEPARLMELVLEAEDLLPVWMATAGGEQRVANLRKLLEMTRQGLLGGQVEEMVRNLGRLVEAPPEEAQAPLMGEEAQVVRIMTVHQAKGLQFPVVVLADLASKAASGGGRGEFPGPDEQGVISLAPWDPERGDRLHSPIYRKLHDRQRAREEAEAARLFYVACTRAQERLILCLTSGTRQHLWAKWVQDMVLGDAAVEEVECTEPEGPGVSAVQPPVDSWPAALPPEPGPREQEGAALVARCLEGPPPLPAAGLVVRESVSGLEDWLACPWRYVFTRRWGLDLALLSPWGSGGPGGAAELGSLVHRLLELADLWSGPSCLETVIQRINPPAKLAARALELARGWWQSGLAQEVARLDPGQVGREVEFTLLLPAEGDRPNLEIVGEADLVLEKADGVTIVDYKVTTKVDTGAYRHQMALYALAWWQRQGAQGRPPRCLLCYLQESGPRLVELSFSTAELETFRQRLQEAAARIARLGEDASPHDLPRGQDCSPNCPLARAGLCRPGDGEG